MLGLSGSGSHTKEAWFARAESPGSARAYSIGRAVVSHPLAIRFGIEFEGAAGEALQPLIAALDRSDNKF